MPGKLTRENSTPANNSACIKILNIYFHPTLLYKLTFTLSAQGSTSSVDNPKSIKSTLYIGGRWEVIAILIMSTQIAISLCTVRTHLFKKERKKKRQLQ
jgi:hypothetical protein